MRAAAFAAALLPLVAAFTPIVIDIEFDQLALPDLEHSGIATPATSRTPFPAASAPALREEDELLIHWDGVPDFDPVAYLDKAEAEAAASAGAERVGGQEGASAYLRGGAARLAPGGLEAAAAGAAVVIL